MKTIVIAYDGSACSDAIFDELQRLGLPERVEAHVISVEEPRTGLLPRRGVWRLVETTALASTAVATISQTEQSKSRALALAEKGASCLMEAFPSWRVNATGDSGSVALTVVRKAEEVDADIIFIGSRSRTLIDRYFLGSISQKVAAEAKCSVHICRPHVQFSSAPRILLAVDDTPGSRAVVEAVMQHVWPKGTLASAVRVIESPFSRWEEGADEDPDEWLRSYLSNGDIERDPSLYWLEKAAKNAAQDLQLTGLSASAHTLVGEPKQTILNWADHWKADCIFIGDSGTYHRGTKSLGTVASAVAVRGRCSVEIVRPKRSMDTESRQPHQFKNLEQQCEQEQHPSPGSPQHQR